MAINSACVKFSVINNAAPTALRNFRSTSTARIKATLPVGQYALEVRANGYETMRSYSTVESNSAGKETFDLTPLSKSSKIKIAEESQTDAAYVIYGYAMNAITDFPLKGVQIRIKESQYSTITDSDGFFSLVVPAETGKLQKQYDGTEIQVVTVHAKVKGYVDVVIQNIFTAGGDSIQFRLEMKPGRGSATIIENQPRIDSENHQIDVDTSTPPSSSLRDWLDGRGNSKSPDNGCPASRL